MARLLRGAVLGVDTGLPILMSILLHFRASGSPFRAARQPLPACAWLALPAGNSARPCFCARILCFYECATWFVRVLLSCIFSHLLQRSAASACQKPALTAPAGMPAAFRQHSYFQCQQSFQSRRGVCMLTKCTEVGCLDVHRATRAMLVDAACYHRVTCAHFYHRSAHMFDIASLTLLTVLPYCANRANKCHLRLACTNTGLPALTLFNVWPCITWHTQPATIQTNLIQPIPTKSTA